MRRGPSRATTALVAIACIACVPFSAAAQTSAVRVTVAGDSLALGIGASDSSRGFAFDLFRRIVAERPGSEITNLAIGGTTASDVERLEIPRLARTQPTVVLLEVGANDAVRRTPVTTFARNYASLVHETRRAAPQARIILFNVPDVAISTIFDATSKPALRRLVSRYNASVENVARGTKMPVVDLYHISESARRNVDRFLSADLFHPSDAGHAAIAAASWPVVERAIRGR